MKPGDVVKIHKAVSGIGDKEGIVWRIRDDNIVEVFVNESVFNVPRKFVIAIKNGKVVTKCMVGDKIIFTSNYGNCIGIVLNVGTGVNSNDKSRKWSDDDDDEWEWEELVEAENRLNRRNLEEEIKERYKVRVLDTMGTVWISEKQIIGKLNSKPIIILELENNNKLAILEKKLKDLDADIIGKYKVNVLTKEVVPQDAKPKRCDTILHKYRNLV